MAVISRRTALIALAATGAPRLSRAQAPSRVHRVGFVVPRSSSDFGERTEAFRSGMRGLGYAEGRNLAVEWRFADGDYRRLPALVDELVRMPVDVLVVDSTPGVKAAQSATSTIPIVMVSVGDPVASGFVASLSRPGGNITGLSNVVADVSAKYVELLLLALPGLTRIAVLVNPDNVTHPRVAGQVESAARPKGIKVARLSARTPAEIEAAVAAARRDGAGALVALGDPFFGQQGRQIAELALKHRLPTLQTNRALAEAGALMSYGQDLTEHYRRAATFVDRILKGATPRDLPVEQSTKIELVVNLRTAKALGLAVPQALIVRADDVIE